MEVNGGEKGEPCGVRLVDGQLLEESTNEYEDKKSVQGAEPSLANGKAEESVEGNASGCESTVENSQNERGLVNGKEGTEDVDQSDDSVSTKEGVVDGMHSDKDVANDEDAGSSTTGNTENFKDEESVKEECLTSPKSEKVSNHSEVSKSSGDEGNFNENSSVKEEIDLQNGKIEEPKPTKKIESAKKEVTKPALVKPEALYRMPDFPSEKEHSKKPEEQFNVLIKTNDKKHLKQWLRSNILSVGHPVRSKLWQGICKLVFKFGSSIFQEMVDEIFKGGKIILNYVMCMYCSEYYSFKICTVVK